MVWLYISPFRMLILFSSISHHWVGPLIGQHETWVLSFSGILSFLLSLCITEKINERCERDPWERALHCCQFTSQDVWCANDFMCFYLNEGFSYYPLLMHIHVVVDQPSSTLLCFLISDRILKTSTTLTEVLQGLWCSLTSFLVEILILTIHTAGLLDRWPL